ncbi:hypothetical protein SAMN04488061_3196 [Filomicrobium insigne]|uniref:Uncharacterized protein n=1 Tax=Filomicrobium insigne TaxID=418854 RepID=A0A1H0T876_9HYPH|nr:hypothetical protein [Filomicrobium insigne]SDP50001.1 hypothetical protein SAMN04488061_3196 [Filomicrobium insigne]
MTDASSPKSTKSATRHHRGWREWLRNVFLGPLAFLIVINDTIYRRILGARFSRERSEVIGLKARPRSMLRGNAVSVVPSSGGTERQAHRVGGRLVLVGTKDVRRRAPATRIIRATSIEVSQEAHDALISNLRRCLSPAAVGAVIEEISERGLCGYQQFVAILDRLVDLEATEEEVKAALACAGLMGTCEVDMIRRVIKLKFDPISGHMDWHHRAVRSIGFSRKGRALLPAARRDMSRLRAVVHLDAMDRMVGWDLPPEDTLLGNG